MSKKDPEIGRGNDNPIHITPENPSITNIIRRFDSVFIGPVITVVTAAKAIQGALTIESLQKACELLGPQRAGYVTSNCRPSLLTLGCHLSYSIPMASINIFMSSQVLALAPGVRNR